MDIYDATAGRVVASLSGMCDHMSDASLTWSPDGALLVVAAPGTPVTAYALPSHGS